LGRGVAVKVFVKNTTRIFCWQFTVAVGRQIFNKHTLNWNLGWRFFAKPKGLELYCNIALAEGSP
jgi:hypothetical protein